MRAMIHLAACQWGAAAGGATQPMSLSAQRAVVEALTARMCDRSTVEQLAKDLRAAFPGVKGFSRSNFFAMRQIYQAWRDAPDSVQQLVRCVVDTPHRSKAAAMRSRAVFNRTAPLRTSRYTFATSSVMNTAPSVPAA
jgi:hypothetical protein